MSDVVENNPNEAKFRAAVYPELERKYSAQLPKLRWHCFRAKEISENDQINFLYELDQIVSGYERRINDPTYFRRMADCLADLTNAAELLGASVGKLAKLDAHHFIGLLKTIEVVAPRQLLKEIASPKSTVEPIELFAILKKAEILSLVLSTSLSIIGGSDVLPRGRGNPPLPYPLPTLDLIHFWEKWTGQEVPYAKAFPHEEKKVGGHPAQSASEFIRLVLTIIDPKVTDAMAITSINNARKVRKTLSDELARLRAGPNRLLSLLRSLAAEGTGGSIPQKT